MCCSSSHTSQCWCVGNVANDTHTNTYTEESHEDDDNAIAEQRSQWKLPDGSSWYWRHFRYSLAHTHTRSLANIHAICCCWCCCCYCVCKCMQYNRATEIARYHSYQHVCACVFVCECGKDSSNIRTLKILWSNDFLVMILLTHLCGWRLLERF